MADHRYKMNRAVGIMNKGDEFTSEPDDRMVVSLLGAGYMDDLGPVDGEQYEVPREPTKYAADTGPASLEARKSDLRPDRDGSEEDGAV